MPMDADRKDKHDTLMTHERTLSNGKRNDIDSINAAVIEVCRVVKTILATDFLKPSDLEVYCPSQHVIIEKAIKAGASAAPKKVHPINWQVCAIIITIITAIYKLLTGE